MKVMNVEFWSSEENFEECGELGCTAAITFENVRDPEGEASLLAGWAKKEVTSSRDRILVEADWDVVRISVCPLLEEEQYMEGPEDWDREEQAMSLLRRSLHNYRQGSFRLVFVN